MKRASRDRRVPLLQGEAYARPQHGGTWKQYRESLAAFAARPYDARRTFATWCEDAGIPERRISIYLGHARKNVTQLYTRRELDGFLQEDGELLAAWVRDPQQLGVEA